MTTKTEVLKLALEALKENQHLVADNQPHAYVMEYNSIIEKCEEALAQTEQEPVAWEQFYPDIGKPQIEQPKVRTGDCLLVGVCASEGHKIQAKQEPWRESASDYERGVIDGRQMQRQSNVDKAVNRMAQPEQEPATKEQIREAMIFNLPLYTTPPQRKPFNHHEFGYWWFEYGSGLHPLKGEYQEEHAYRVATAAWQAAHGIKE